ncbi:MAG TPA: acyl-CoA dehydrogenase [Gaiellaceae bacterium]|nr:acyl-CoA dehydrogenase [Gaiellaceae bacterium]
MDFAFSDVQRQLQREVRGFLAANYPLDRDWDGPQNDRWDELAELGWLGGAELSFVEEAILFEETGYALYPGPFLATVGFALPALGPDEREAAAAGEVRWSAEVKGLVPWLGSVDMVVDSDGNAQLARGEELPTVDPTRPLGRLERSNGTPLPGARDVPRARTAMAAEAVGVAQRALELGIEYAKTREQFGKKIGVYQAVSHQLANTYTDVELARSLVYWAAWCVAEGDEQAAVAAAAAKAFAAEAAVAACERSIQVHGGIGFTWEHTLHRFYKRALWLEGVGSRPPELRAEVADALLGTAVAV